jgi:hypothetical protein
MRAGPRGLSDPPHELPVASVEDHRINLHLHFVALDVQNELDFRPREIHADLLPFFRKEAFEGLAQGAVQIPPDWLSPRRGKSLV